MTDIDDATFAVIAVICLALVVLWVVVFAHLDPEPVKMMAPKGTLP